MKCQVGGALGHMSALPPKADMCGAPGYVRFGPIADIDRIEMNEAAKVSEFGALHSSASRPLAEVSPLAPARLRDRARVPD